MRYRLSADIGGTFTDVVRYDIRTGVCDTTKVPTTIGNLADGIVAGFDQITGGDYTEVFDIVHGTTNGLNSLIERTGARTAVVTTRGYRDIYEIGRGNHKEMYNVRYRKPCPLVARRDIFEVTERTRTDGMIETPVSSDDVRRVAALIDGDYESIAICLLNSFASPENEKAIRDQLTAALSRPVSMTLSSAVSPESREFERFSTAILNAYVSPAMDRYLGMLEGMLRDRGFSGQLAVMNSNGGRMSLRTAREQPVRTLMSGPIGGVIGAARVGAAHELRDVIAVDMGGTSFDVSMLDDGELDIATESDVEGVPVLVPTVSTLSVGAGGGSIAWTEASAMRVGPRSSGAVPGPICYGRGGTEPTVTDANLVLGRIDPDRFLGGRMVLDAPSALQAFATYGREHGLSPLESAEGALEIANSKMADAIREITLWRGKDVREFTLLAYGGAGPMHAALIAAQLDVNRVIVPPEPGAFSAWGMLQADLTVDRARAVLRRLDLVDPAELRAMAGELRDDIDDVVAADRADLASTTFSDSLDLRYVGQEYSITLVVGDEFDPSRVREDFDRSYERLYGFCTPTAPVEILNLRVVGTVLESNKPPLSVITPGVEVTPVSTLAAHFDGTTHEMPVYERASLPEGLDVAGPALVCELTSTVLVPAGWSVRCDATGSLLLEKRRSAGTEE
jgi:N-methylhydantoinase A